MIHFCRTITAVVLAASIAAPATLFAQSDVEAPVPQQLTYRGQPLDSIATARIGEAPAMQRDMSVSSSAGQWGYGRRRRHNDAAVTAMLLGAAGAIAGTAVLVYANRPECSMNANLGGCGYGTKVVGTAVLSAGLVGLLVGAVAWR